MNGDIRESKNSANESVPSEFQLPFKGECLRRLVVGYQQRCDLSAMEAILELEFQDVSSEVPIASILRW
jgi:hypothetical protein